MQQPHQGPITADMINSLLLDPQSELFKAYVAAKDSIDLEHLLVAKEMYFAEQNQRQEEKREKINYREAQLKIQAEQNAMNYHLDEIAAKARISQPVHTESNSDTSSIQGILKQLVQELVSLKVIENKISSNQKQQETVKQAWQKRKMDAANHAVKQLAQPLTLSNGITFILDEKSERAERIHNRLVATKLPSESEQPPARDHFMQHIAIFAEYMQGLEEENPSFTTHRPVGYIRALTMHLNQINFRRMQDDTKETDRKLISLTTERITLIEQRDQHIVSIVHTCHSITQQFKLPQLGMIIANNLPIDPVEEATQRITMVK